MLTQERLKELYTYDPITGIFTTNKVINGRASSIGEVVGTKLSSHDKFYLTLTIDGEMYRLAHLAFLYMENRLPTKIVDHKNGDTLNNTWSNLREATTNQNSWNYKKPVTNTSGVKGLYKRETKGLVGWQVRVMKNNKAYTCSFAISKYGNDWEKAKEAAINYLQRLRESLHGEFTNHG